ncbi:nucleotide-diphospho-sugar transferase, partial [Aureobasidium melanogenum]
MNFTYTDESGNLASCTANCPLPQGNTSYQDFHFVNSVGMNDFRIDISAWYGAGGGLSGIELFQDDIYAFAVSDFNEPRCDSVSTTGANSTATGPWVQTPSGQSTSDYLTATLNSSVTSNSAQVVFMPDIKQSGNYSVTLYTPGCIQDDTCSSRGIVNITGSMTTEGSAIATTLYQTNYYDKYDQIYYGYVDAASDSFRPEVTLTPLAGQNTPLTVVAQRVRFELVTSTGGLNGLYDYNPNIATVNTDFSASKIDSAAMSLDTGAKINALAVYNDVTYVAGNFSNGDIHNIFSIGSGNATSLPGGGLNSVVRTMYQNGSTIYVGGNFTNTATAQTPGLSGVAAFSIADNSWTALGAGVNGPVWAIVPLQLNITGKDQETVLAVSGDFTSVNAVGSNATYSADGFAAWVPSRGNWLHNLANATVALSGGLLAQTMVADYGQLLAGSLVASQIGMSDAVALSGSGRPSLSPLGVSISASQGSSSMRKRAATSQNVTGVATGYFYLDNGKNMTILGGHFTANSSAGNTIDNLLIVDNTNGQNVIGLPNTVDADSTVLALEVRDTSLFAGGSITGTSNGDDINGLLVWDLSQNALASSQPAALAGSSVTVNTIAAQPGSANVYVGGNFENAGSMSCPSFCMYDTSTGQWMPPTSGLNGTINTMTWRSNNQLIVGGDFTTGGNHTKLALYDAKKQTFTDLGTSANLPGAVTAMTPANPNYDNWWVAGTANNGSSFLQKYDGTTWQPVTGLGAATVIRGLQVISLTEKHQLTDLVPSNEVLLITGSVELPDNGNASAVLFNGTTFQPFILTTTANGGQGSLSGMFVQNPSNFLSSKSHHLALGLVVLIGLAIACGLTFLLVVIGILVERHRRRRQGYVPMPQLRPDQHANLNRIPPESLFGTLEKRDTAPRTPSPYAYVFYATQDVYACSVLVNIHQLRTIHKTPHRIFVLITSEVSPFYFSAFEDSGATISLQTPPSLANNTEGAGYYKDCLLKLYAFKMQELDPSLQKVVVLDSDQLILRNLDHLFTTGVEVDVAAPRAYWISKEAFSTAMMVIGLSAGLWRKVETALRSVRINQYDMDVANEMFGDTVLMLPGSYVALNSHWEDWNLPSWFNEDDATTNHTLEIPESRVEDLEKRQEEKQQGYDFEPSDYETVSTPGSKDAASPEDKEAQPAFPEIPNNKASKESTTENHPDNNLPPTIPDSTDPSKHSDGRPHLPGGIAPPSHPSSDTNTTTIPKTSQEELKKRRYYTELFSLYDQVSVLHFTAMGKPWGVNKNILSERRPEAHPLFAEQFMAWRKVAKEICATGVVVEL